MACGDSLVATARKRGDLEDLARCRRPIRRVANQPRSMLASTSPEADHHTRNFRKPSAAFCSVLPRKCGQFSVA